ncbi:MAG TPA: hypothetical protein VHI75_02360 [Casimicrobiaceae bacterium]|nr:hypothetical protein [Candidatus Eremiobacteraceae bacterium]HVR92661.1 hypothetical protein [Casimicrobiaceae bacterium]
MSRAPRVVLDTYEFLVTGDRDLLALANRFTCAIMKPEAWLQTLAKV